MILDELDSSRAPFDFCVIGSGPAGIITALELERLLPGRRILLLEYGAPEGTGRNELDDSIRVATPDNHHEPYECTNKGFGGSSATWGGRCVMYDEIDFVPREPFKSDCTWPAGVFAEAHALMDRTAAYFECAPGPYNLHELPGRREDYRPIAEGFVEGAVTDSSLEKWSRPTRFGRAYHDAVAKSASISLASGWQLCRFDAPDATGAVRTAVARHSATGKNAHISAQVFVLAAGAQETTRVLLKSRELFASVGGQPPALGKFYQGHVSGKIASVQFSGDPEKTDFGFSRTVNGEYVRRRFQFSNATMLERNILNTAIWLDNPLYFDPAHRSGAMSFMYLAMVTPGLGKRLAPPTIAHSITKGKVNAVGAHLWNIVRDLPFSLWVPASIFFRRYCLSRKLPGVFLKSRRNRYALHFHAEQLPVAANRMELGPDGESLVIHYGYTDEDVASVIRAHAALDEWLKKCGCGQLQYWYPPEMLARKIREGSKDGVHQVGTTRMADSAAAGVVDRNLRVWGTENVYVCSSSVFPTSGQANPTFMLGVFAVRLAEHLARRASR